VRRAAESLSLWWRATPTILRVGAAEAFAYRAEFVVWMFTTTMPLIMLGLWTTVAHEGPFGGYDSDDFVAYYVAAMFVRTLTGSWVVWQINDEIRTGYLSMRLLRPIHPFVGYAGTHLSAIPLRGAIALPFAGILLWSSARSHVITDPAQLATFAAAALGAWALVYFWMVIVGTLAFWVEKSMAVFELYLGFTGILSGYLIPLDLLPGWLRATADVLPFRFMLAYPVELLIGQYTRAEALALLGQQWLFVVATVLLATLAWRAGVRRYEAYGA
jgi:ABC-2 type transport system permease protein